MSQTNKRPILDPSFWKQRLELSKRTANKHHAVFVCTRERWEAIEARHREILAQFVGYGDRILDVGCGWGRLLDLLPQGWDGAYMGVDLSPDFIRMARIAHPQRSFLEGDIREVALLENYYDLAVMVSFRPMVRRELGNDVWDEMERAIRRSARKLLYLEFDALNLGSLE